MSTVFWVALWLVCGVGALAFLRALPIDDPDDEEQQKGSRSHKNQKLLDGVKQAVQESQS